MKPELKQFGTLTQADFEQFPVWVNVHSVNYDESWYDETDEETFRPWSGALPVDPSVGMFLVRSQVSLADGTKLVAFLTPATGSAEVTDSELASVQPYLFSKNRTFITFWVGILR